MKLLKKGSWKFYFISSIPIIFMVVGMLSLSVIMAYSYSGKNVTIVDGRQSSKITTHKNLVSEVLYQKQIVLNEKDIIIPAINETVADNSIITIKRAKPVTLIVEGQTKSIYTNVATVQELLDEQQIVLVEQDKLNLDPTDRIIKNLVLKISKAEIETVVELEPIAFRISERQTSQISRGSRRIAKEGTEGQKEVTYQIVYEDGKVVSKEAIDEKIIKKPVSAVIEIGVEPRETTVSRAGDLRYTKEIYMSASAYTAGYESTGKSPGDYGYGRTATGMTARRGVVAVDPRVIPLGTKLYIESADGYGDYGYAVAADTGGAIRGNKIDLFYESVSDALHFGRRTVKVYVLEN